MKVLAPGEVLSLERYSSQSIKVTLQFVLHASQINENILIYLLIPREEAAKFTIGKRTTLTIEVDDD